MSDTNSTGRTYTCPMHPRVQEEAPGLCPLCGMNLLPQERHTARASDSHAGHNPSSFLFRFFIVFIISIPLVAYSELMQGFLALPPLPKSELLFFLLGTVAFLYGGWTFLVGAARELSARMPGMMTLVALALSAAYLWSAYATIFSAGKPLWWELSTLTAIMLLGHWLEMKAVQSARGALREIALLLPKTATVERGGATHEIPAQELREGDIAIIKPGERVPADGIVESGESELNESVITGESRPVIKKKDSKVIAGSINGDGALRIRITETGERTFLAGIARLVADAERSKSRLQILSDRAALLLTIIAVTIGGGSFFVWIFIGAPAAFAAERLVAVLVIACPHALGLAVPLVASISTRIAAANGFLVKSRLALESARDTNIVLFDKTGTLTTGEFGVDEVIRENAAEKDILARAAAVNNYSEHPIAQAIVREAIRKNIPVSPVQRFERIPGKGARAWVGDTEIVVGNDAALSGAHIDIPASAVEKNLAFARKGKTIIHVAAEGKFLGSIALSDTIRTESREAIAALRAQGIQVAMITGDSADVAAAVAQELGIAEFFSGVLPSQKSEKVEILQKRGLRVAMVGDGVNDAPALAQADIGIAIGAGTNVAIESAGIILTRNDPRDIPAITTLSRATYKKMKENLWWASGYNIIAIPLAAGALAWQGILLPPALGAVFMSLSTIIVAGNALLLKRRLRALRAA